MDTGQVEQLVASNWHLLEMLALSFKYKSCQHSLNLSFTRKISDARLQWWTGPVVASCVRPQDLRCQTLTVMKNWPDDGSTFVISGQGRLIKTLFGVCKSEEGFMENCYRVLKISESRKENGVVESGEKYRQTFNRSRLCLLSPAKGNRLSLL